MEAAHQARAGGRGEGARGVEREEDGGQVGGVGLEAVLAVEDGAAFGVGAFGGEEDVGGEVQGGWVGGGQVVGGAGDDGGVVGEEQAEDLVADFAGEVVEGEGHWWGWGIWEFNGSGKSRGT